MFASLLLGRRAASVLGLAATLALAPATIAKPPAPPPQPPAVGVQRIEIYQGPNRYVDYVPYGPMTVGDRLAVSALQRSENELTTVDNLQRLRQMYVNDELNMEPKRLYVQNLLYGSTISQSSYSMGTYSGGWGGRGYSYPYAWNGYGYGGYGGFGGIWGAAGSSSSMTRSLAYGMGNEGVIKNVLVQGLAQPATADHAVAAGKSFDEALTRVAASEPLRKSLGLPANAKAGVAPSTFPGISYPPGPVLMRLVCGHVLSGTVAREDMHWIVVRSLWGELVIPKREVLSYEPLPLATPATP